jgi:hypothetical protein
VGIGISAAEKVIVFHEASDEKKTIHIIKKCNIPEFAKFTIWEE